MGKNGHVTLVGAGPGDPGLLTLAGKAAIEKAEVILYDRLVGTGILAMMPASAEKIDVGKNKGNHPTPQAEINRLIADYALAGKNVVRLKGGDPYLFGRGAEELERLVPLGIRFTVVPGITSAIAAPACAGIPVTHRDYSSSLHILTGHGKENSPPDIPYNELARLGGTLVFLMGLSTAGDICAGLIAAGLPADTPAALIENGTRPNQRRLDGTVENLPRRAKENAIASPAVLVIGKVCALAEQFDWMARLPLWGKRILSVSSQTTGGRLAAALRAEGCQVDEHAGIILEPIAPPAPFWRELCRYGWIAFTSRFGVECFFDGLFANKRDIREIAHARFAAVGSQTARELSQHGLAADFVPEDFNGKSLGDGLARLIGRDAKVLLFRAEAGGADLPDGLRNAGIAFDDVPAYRTIENRLDPETRGKVEAGGYDAVTFTSASAAEAFAESLAGCDFSRITAYCIGETTAAAARRRGMRTTTSPEATIEAMARMIVEKEAT